MPAIDFTFGFRLATLRGETSAPLLRGHFTTADDAAIIATELLDEPTAVRLCQSPKLVREEDRQAFLIRRVDRCRESRLVMLTLQRV